MSIRTIMRVMVLGAAVMAVAASSADEAWAQKYTAVAGTFVGTAAQCDPSPAGARIVTSAWLRGMGLPDNGTAHPAGSNAHFGLLLSKNGPTPNCSAPFAEIDGWVAGGTLSALGFDYRLGGHCGAGAPRFNVQSGATTYFFGCFHGTVSVAPQDPANWRRIVFNAAGAPVGGYPGAEGFVFGTTPVDSIDIVFDEGTDVPSPDGEAPAGVGLATIDNIRINNTLITKKGGNPILP